MYMKFKVIVEAFEPPISEVVVEAKDEEDAEEVALRYLKSDPEKFVTKLIPMRRQEIIDILVIEDEVKQ